MNVSAILVKRRHQLGQEHQQPKQVKLYQNLLRTHQNRDYHLLEELVFAVATYGCERPE